MNGQNDVCDRIRLREVSPWKRYKNNEKRKYNDHKNNIGFLHVSFTSVWPCIVLPHKNTLIDEAI